MNGSMWKRAGGYGLVLLLLGACGSDDGKSATTTPQTSAGSDTPLSETSEADLSTICDWYVDGTDYDAVCEFLAVTSTADEDARERWRPARKPGRHASKARQTPNRPPRKLAASSGLRRPALLLSGT